MQSKMKVLLWNADPSYSARACPEGFTRGLTTARLKRSVAREMKPIIRVAQPKPIFGSRRRNMMG
jgi:hypothetical protein